MAHLLHLDSSLRTVGSRSRTLSAYYAKCWLAANPGGTTTYRDLAADPVPHLTEAAFTANLVPAEERTAEQARERAITETIVGELTAASHVVVGIPLYNFGPPSTFKSWFDRIVVPGVTMRVEWERPSVTIVAARGGGYGPGTPREGWDHREPWIHHAFSALGITDIDVIHAELTLARESPAMAPLDLGAAEDASLEQAHQEIDALFA
jgi:FMN-dependent NADH-azoreductase